MSKEKKRGFIFGTLFGLALAVGLISVARYFGLHLFVRGSASQQIYDKTKVVERCIDDFYQGEAEDEQLINGAVKGMVSALGDKYSQYYTQEEYNEIMDGINGSYVGIGVSLQTNEDNCIVVVKVTEGGPAKKAGIKAGDRIVSVDGKDVSGSSIDDVVSMIKTDENDERAITIGIERDSAGGNTEKLEKQVVCEEIKVISVTSENYGNAGYIKISEFDKETSTQFGVAVENFKNDTIKGLVIDVRNNGGGSLDAAIKMLDELLPEGELITEKSKRDGDKVYHSTDEKSYNKPIVVLINENSASASEVFAGTLQARGAAQLVGTKSFGKGIVQTVLSLERSCGGGLKLTTAEYFLPGGVSIHGKGLTPDVEIKLEEEGTTGTGSDNQLKEALKMIQG